MFATLFLGVPVIICDTPNKRCLVNSPRPVRIMRVLILGLEAEELRMARAYIGFGGKGGGFSGTSRGVCFLESQGT